MKRNSVENEHVTQGVLFIDAHVDLPWFMKNHMKDSSLSSLDSGPFTLQKAKKSGFRLFCSALYCEDRYNGNRSLQHLQDLLSFTLDHFDEIAIIKNKNELQGLVESPEQLGTLFLLENADALAEETSFISRLKEKGIAIVGLTHIGKNRLADGNTVLYPDGLTHKGREVVNVLNENGLLVDVAHLHPRCFWQLLDLIESPIISSHTGIKEVCDISRNIDLAQVKEILQRGGVVGISFNPEMLTSQGLASVKDVFAHMDTLVQKFGPEGVGIGSDYCGFDLITDGLEDITGISNLIDIMIVHGYVPQDVNKIMGLNWLGIYESIL